MKLRPLFVLLLFVVSAGILVWIYYSASRASQEPKKSPWTETLSDLDACGRRKHVKSVQYDRFARIADEEHRRRAARLFRAMALSERLQEHNCANAIVRLGGSYIPPAKVVAFRGTTDSNLERSIAYERKALETLKGEDIDRALARNNRYAARILIWASSADMRHIAMMNHCLDPQASGQTGYLVCPVCGNIFDTEYIDPYCPFCLTSGKEFIRFE